jgi:hypothetical protein
VEIQLGKYPLEEIYQVIFAVFVWNFIFVTDTEHRFDNDVDIGNFLKVRKTVSYFRHNLPLSG